MTEKRNIKGSEVFLLSLLEEGVENVICDQVSAMAASRGRLVRSRLATFRKSGVKSFRRLRHPGLHSVSTKSRPRSLAWR